MKNDITFEQLTKFSSVDTEAIRNLTRQLGSNSKTLTDEDMQEMLDSPNTHILVVRELENQRIVGMVTIFVYRIPYTKKAYIDDFVIDENYRGRGIGTRLFNNAINLAKEKGVAYIDFTSSPEKIQGNKFYEKMGFKKRDTNIYRLNFS